MRWLFFILLLAIGLVWLLDSGLLSMTPSEIGAQLGTQRVVEYKPQEIRVMPLE